MKKEITCDCCGKGGVMSKRITRCFGKGDRVVVIDGIPLCVCPHCGESYFTASTLQEIERLRMHRAGLTVQGMAPVLSYV
ncbi:MAG: YgiT-type zinc finger protein [Kiritimatiellia bacterium]|jgi:YgiT-type zinc finger domain-containing protein|nr:YgiT-type zinc finger protein [Kiritimatiellia bacterium]